MAEVDIAPNFGAELKDGFKPVNAWVSQGIGWLEDVQGFYRERSAIEKEYSAKLSALAKKYFEKKARKQSTLSVGETPTVTPGSLESASMTTWTVQLTTLESRANEHDQFATQLISHVAEPLKHAQTRYEELRKSHTEYASKLEKERDGAYADLRKTKGKYDSVCQDVENKRKKMDSAFDMSKQKARSAYAQQEAEMRNVKNTYLLNINVTNKQKERYYEEYVPELLDSLQDLNESRIAKLNAIWMTAAELELATLARSQEYIKHLSGEVPRNNPVLDSMMFARHNSSQWQMPGDFTFEPSPVWLDDESIATDEASKIYLQNILSKSKASMGTYKRELEQKRREVDNAKRARENIRSGKDKRDEVECVRAIFHLMEVMHEVERQKVTAEVEIITITTVVGDVTVGARNHEFVAQTFKIPTNCDHCGDRIWGLSAKGFICSDCGYTCHTKCQMKVPADCPGELSKDEKKALKAKRQEATNIAPPTNGAMGDSQSDLPSLNRSDTVNSMNTLSSGYSASAQRSVSGGPPVPAENEKPKPAARRNRIVAPPPTTYASEAPLSRNGSSEPKGKMMYAYQQNGEGEISVSEGREIIIVEPDDGSGWMKVRSGSSEGLVPAAYVESIAPSTPTPTHSSDLGRPGSTYSASSVSLAGSLNNAPAPGKKKGPAVAPRRGAKKLKYVEALYEYAAQSDAEFSMAEGDRFVLVNRDAGDGWADVEKGGVTKSVPANYIQDV